MASGVELATAYVNLTVSGKDIVPQTRKAFSAVDQQADRTGRSAGKRMGSGIAASAKSVAGPVIAALGVAAIGGFVKSAVSAGSNLQQAIGGVDAVFKKDAGSIKASAEGAAQSLGLPKTAYMELATALGAGLKNKGLKDYAKQTENLITIGGDLAAQFGGSTKDAVDALASAMRGESDPIERYGISLNETAVNAELAARGQTKLKGAALEQAKAAARIALVTKQAADAQGAFARESDTLAGKQARLSASWENIKTKIGSALLPVMEKLAGFVSNRMLPVVGQLVDILFNGDFTSGPFSEDSKLVDVMFRVRDGIAATAGVAKQLFGILFQGDFKSGPLSEDGKFVDVLFRVRDGFFKVRDGAAALGGWLKGELWPALQSAYQTILPAVKAAFDTIRGGASGGGIEGAGAAFRAFGAVLTTKVIPVVAFIVKNVLPVVAANLRSLIEVVKITWKVFTTMATIAARAFSIVLGAILAVTKTFQGMLRALSNVPGFGWAKSAADKMGGTIAKLHAIKNGIDNIPSSKSVTIAVSTKLLGPGRINVGGKQVNVGMRAGGGPVAANTPYWVGDNPDGTLNRTSELFVPKTSGTILNQSQIARSSTSSVAEPRRKEQKPATPQDFYDAVYQAMTDASSGRSARSVTSRKVGVA